MSLHNRKSLAPYIKDDIQYYQHQVEGIRRMAVMRSVLLADDMGLGKSLQALTVWAIDIHRGLGNKALVVCPASLRVNWAEEIDKFMGDAIHTVVMSSKDAAPARLRKIEAFRKEKGPKILVVNYELLLQHLEEINKCLFDIAIFDEAHYLKNHQAKRTKAALRVWAKRFILMTGSPILNHVNELWPLLHRIGVDNLPSYWAFVNRYCVYGGYQSRTIVGTKNEAELIKTLNQYMIRRKKEDVLDLPAVQYIQRTVEMHALQKKYYDQIVQDMRLTVSTGDNLDVSNALTKFLRLKQICGTTATMPGEEKDESHKLDQAVEDALEILAQGHRLVVFTQFRGVLKAFKARLEKASQPRAGWDHEKGAIDGKGRKPPQFPIFELHGDVPSEKRQQAIHDWASHRTAGVMIAMFQVAGVGLNMTAARHGLFLDKQFVPALNQQAVDRMHRIGADKTQPVQIIEYFVRGSVEARVEKILSTKRKVFDNIVEGSEQFNKKLIQELLREELANESAAAAPRRGRPPKL